MREWMMAIGEHLTRFPAARALMLSGARMPAVWAAVWLPVLRLMVRQGMTGADLALASEWFGRSAFEALIGHHNPTSDDVIFDILEIDSLVDHDRRLLQDLLATRGSATKDHRVAFQSDDPFRFAVQHTIAGLSLIIDGKASRAKAPADTPALPIATASARCVTVACAAADRSRDGPIAARTVVDIPGHKPWHRARSGAVPRQPS